MVETVIKLEEQKYEQQAQEAKVCILRCDETLYQHNNNVDGSSSWSEYKRTAGSSWKGEKVN